MTSVIYLNERFLSCDNYVKVSVEFVGRGIFSVVYNPRTKKIQRQRCISPYHFKNIVEGRNPSIIRCKDFDIKTANVSFNYFKEESLKHIQICLKELANSFKQYICLDKNIDFLERKEILEKIYTFESDFASEVMKEKLKGKAEEENKEVETWQNVDASLLDKEELCSLAKAISDEKNPITGVKFNDKWYRILKKDNEELCLQVKSSVEKVTEIKVQNNSNVRKFERMAKMINANGLTEFVNGNFYAVVDVLKFNDKSYFKLKDDNGIEHCIYEKRIKPVSVYTEPPNN